MLVSFRPSGDRQVCSGKSVIITFSLNYEGFFFLGLPVVFFFFYIISSFFICIFSMYKKDDIRKNSEKMSKEFIFVCEEVNQLLDTII